MSILYGVPLSPFVRKVAIFLEEKAIPYEWHMLPPHSKDPEFMAASPLGKIPAFRDDEVALADSSVICAYLEKCHPLPALYPSQPEAYGRALWLEEYFDSTLIKPMRAIYAEGFGNQTFYGKAPDLVRRKENEALLAGYFAYLETAVSGSNWAAGEEFSIADISLAVGFANLTLAGYALDASTFPACAAYIARITARPSFVKITKAMDAFVSKL